MSSIVSVGSPSNRSAFVHQISRLCAILLLYGALLFGAAMALLPLLWMVAASFMPAGEANSYPPSLWPSTITFEHYKALFTRLDLARYLFNSTLLAGTVTLIALPVGKDSAGTSFHWRTVADAAGQPMTGQPRYDPVLRCAIWAINDVAPNSRLTLVVTLIAHGLGEGETI